MGESVGCVREREWGRVWEWERENEKEDIYSKIAALWIGRTRIEESTGRSGKERGE